MQRGDFATKICEIATKFSYLVANCDWIFLLISSPTMRPPCLPQCKSVRPKGHVHITAETGFSTVFNVAVQQNRTDAEAVCPASYLLLWCVIKRWDLSPMLILFESLKVSCLEIGLAPVNFD